MAGHFVLAGLALAGAMTATATVGGRACPGAWWGLYPALRRSSGSARRRWRRPAPSWSPAALAWGSPCGGSSCGARWTRAASGALCSGLRAPCRPLPRVRGRGVPGAGSGWWAAPCGTLCSAAAAEGGAPVRAAGRTVPVVGVSWAAGAGVAVFRSALRFPQRIPRCTLRWWWRRRTRRFPRSCHCCIRRFHPVRTRFPAFVVVAAADMLVLLLLLLL